LLGSIEIAVPSAATAVLGDIATPDVVAPLAKVALNDNEERVRFLAVRGLAEATGATKAPTTAVFRWQPGQTNMRKVDDWQTLATKPIDQQFDLAA
jgi:hypothetical protein